MAHLFSSIPDAVSGLLENANCAEWLQGLIVDGIIAGVGAVLGFVPQMLVLFFLLAILEVLRLHGTYRLHHG